MRLRLSNQQVPGTLWWFHMTEGNLGVDGSQYKAHFPGHEVNRFISNKARITDSR